MAQEANQGTARARREVAWRVFAREFNSSTVELPGDEQYAPSYLLSPLGALINRVYITGVLTECENVGTDIEPLWRGRISGPTDVFYVSAGQFQPIAAQKFSELEVPSLVGVVGKARAYSPDEMTKYISVKVELIKPITQEQRDYWVLESCLSLKHRLGCITEASRMEPPDIKKLTALGYPENLAKGVIDALDQYGTSNIPEFGSLLVNTIKELTQDTGTDSTLPSTSKSLSISTSTSLSPVSTGYESELGAKTEFKTAYETELDQGLVREQTGVKKENEIDPTVSGSGTDESETEPDAELTREVQEKLIFDIINNLIVDNLEGVEYEDVQTHASEQGLEKTEIDEYISSLIDKGIIYEPTLGVFKTV